MAHVIDVNLGKLRDYDFNQLTKHVNIYEGNHGECIQYLFLMTNENTGEIVDITKKQKYQENAVSVHLSVTRASLLEKAPYQLHLSDPKELPTAIQEVIHSSLEKFNAELQEEFNKT